MKNKFSEEIGMCTICSEWTNVLQPCCNRGVYYQGAELMPEDFEYMHQIELELFGKVEPLRPTLKLVK